VDGQLIQPGSVQAVYHTMTRLKPDEAQQVIASYAAGATVYELAAKFGINRKTVSRILHRNEVTMRMVGLSEAQIDEAVKLYENGRSTGWIGHHLQVDARTVHRRLRDRGVTMRDIHGR
jgi:transposase-like protein